MTIAKTGAWTDVLAEEEIPAGGCKVVRRGRKQIAVFRLDGGELQAVDNRCPHEGYPLKTGSLKDGVLTCEWHNWKFRLSDGACLLGGEDVRHYPMAVRDGRVLLDLTDPPPQELLPKIESSLFDAFEEADWAWAARDVERLLDVGRTPDEVLGTICRWVGEHSKYGFDHGLAAAADIGELFGLAGDEVDVALVRALHSAVEPHVRRPARVFPDPQVVTAQTAEQWAGVGAALRSHVENQEVAQAEALMRGAIEGGVEPTTAFDWMTTLVTDHFLNFAHGHIYAVKCEELLARIGWAHAHPVLTCLVTRITTGTREDLLPYMRSYRTAMEGYEERLTGWFGLCNAPRRETLDAEAFLGAVLDGSLAEALAAVADALDLGVAPAEIAVGLGHAAAQRMLRFDAEIDRREDVKQDWLWTTHTLTHVDALAQSLGGHGGPDALRALFQSARFINHLRVLDADPLPAAPVPMAEADVGEVERTLRASCLVSPLVRPIFFQHHVKTVMAAIRLARGARASRVAVDPNAPLAATQHFLSHPLRELSLGSTVRDARAFINEGKVPGSLLPY